MTEKEIQLILKNQKLPKDELDDFWDNFTFLFLVTSILGISIWVNYKNYLNENINAENILFLVFGILLFVYTIWSKKNEKKLKVIKTNLNTVQNIKAIKKLCESEKWKIIEQKNSFFEIYLYTFFKARTHKLIFICNENEVLFNLRNTGSYKGRMPFNFGIDTYKENKIRKKIKNYVQHRV
ncbi:hypothetical protein K8352_19610 [Flavobacteriaceae bacterium F89]|uniref:Uncharacterized protein n=1 Tax=Cerina litoralis TaxID=2874477 RepID=A0AAE3JQB6_9FLAO|nr:hypothetical protein [Cerina litoralis]MCG2462975.1 hypothetical protein [Cerina litoralis]|tara:strand:- start:1096 stop:1638 length:543 start_codon:yes stop_codon:yes gene_type:complete